MISIRTWTRITNFCWLFLFIIIASSSPSLYRCDPAGRIVCASVKLFKKDSVLLAPVKSVHSLFVLHGLLWRTQPEHNHRRYTLQFENVFHCCFVRALANIKVEIFLCVFSLLFLFASFVLKMTRFFLCARVRRRQERSTIHDAAFIFMRIRFRIQSYSARPRPKDERIVSHIRYAIIQARARAFT